MGVTDLDTAFNYQHFGSHETLAAIAADLLPAFSISTKIGYFPEGHDLSTRSLRTAAEQSAIALGRTPDTILLHNPECSAANFEAACEALAKVREEGLCEAWGISTWSPSPLLESAWEVPSPDVIMVRAGLSVPSLVLDAGEQLTERLGARQIWGMSPFAGDAAGPIWTQVDTRQFLSPGQQGSALQSGIATAFAIPGVTRLAVGTSRLDHLADLAEAVSFEVNSTTVNQYRTLLRRRATVNG
nr:aldo/keto reductase [Streptomyces sp. SID13666]